MADAPHSVSAYASFSAQSALLARRTMAAILLTQVVQTSNAQQEQPAPPQKQHKFILSASTANERFSMESSVRLAAEFVEELFAVRLVNFIIFAVIFVFFIVLSRIVPLIFDEILRRFLVPRHLRTGFRYFLQIAILVTGLWLALAAVGIDFFGIVLTFGFVSIILSAGVGPTLTNVFSGLMLQTNDTVQIGHIIVINGIMGRVVEMSLSSVSLRWPDDSPDTVIVPNNHFSQFPITIHKEMSMQAHYAAAPGQAPVGTATHSSAHGMLIKPKVR